MKKLLVLLMVVLAFSACHRPRVRHDGRKKVQHVYVPKDTAQRDDFKEERDTSWQDEDLMVLPEEPGSKRSLRNLPPTSNYREAPSNIDEKIERMMQGEEVDF